MDIAGERILIFGDSLSHHGADDAPEIWNVDQGADRASSAPGDLLASLLLEGGAQAVRIDANVGRSARNFWAGTARRQHRSADDLIEDDRGFAPTKVVIMLGTNDADSGAIDPDAMMAIRDAYAGMGAEVWGIGPPVFTSQALNAKADQVYTMMGSVFGSKLIDARPLSSTQNRAGDGVHFQQASARPFAEALFQSLASASGRPWLKIGLGVAVVGVLLLVVRKATSQGLGAYRFPTERERREKSLRESGAEAIGSGRTKRGEAFTIYGEPNGIYSVALDESLQEIGRAYLATDWEKNAPADYLSIVRVDPEYQRQGIGKKLYDAIEQVTGRPLRPSPTDQSEAAKALWRSRRGKLAGSNRQDRRIAAASLREERAAIRAYGSRLKRAKSKKLQAAIRHARKEERQHAAMFRPLAGRLA